MSETEPRPQQPPAGAELAGGVRAELDRLRREAELDRLRRELDRRLNCRPAPSSGAPLAGDAVVGIVFDGADPTADPVVAIRRADGTIRIAPASGEDESRVWASFSEPVHACAAGRTVTTTVYDPIPRDVLALYFGHDVHAVLATDDEGSAYSPDAVRRRRATRAGERGHAGQVAASDDLLDQLKAAVEGVCGCGCGTPIDADSPSAYFATARCQRRWARTNATNPAAVERRPDHSIYTEAGGSDSYTSGSPIHSSPIHSSPIHSRPVHSGHVHSSMDPHQPAGYHDPYRNPTDRAAVAAALLDLWMADVATRAVMGRTAHPGYDNSPERIMPVNVLTVAERRFRDLLPDINPAFLSRVLTCTRRCCPDGLGAGYRRHCPVCREWTVPHEYEVTGPADHLILRLNACSYCYQVYPGVAYRANLTLDRAANGEETLRLRLESGVTAPLADEKSVLVRDLNAGDVTAAWRHLERQVADRWRYRRTPSDSVMAAVLAHHAYSVVARPDPRNILRITGT